MGSGGIHAARHLKPLGDTSRKILIHSETLRSFTCTKGSNREMIDSEWLKNRTGCTSVRTRISSRRGTHARSLCNAARDCPPSRGRATDAREKESPLTVYDP
ncbi:hypothetical protein CRG98_009143 [Punica granatum]|uniref:Uncharacterized protein n=1 Tax=Punica granatum TaxID=22663 RepID=A0A2I0KQ84_PUNGR|nr:hypothetical protein CRG98_009143 [Punica granatum]